MKMHESGENYLETILVLTKKNGSVRSIDIANELGFSKPSISRAMSLLKDNDYIEIDPSSNIILTPKGLKKANDVYERHQVITNFLVKTLSVDEKIANIDACRIEHILSDDIFDRMKKFIE